MDNEHPGVIQTMYIRSQDDAVLRYFVAILCGGYDMRGVERRFRRFAGDYTLLITSDDLRPKSFVPYLLSRSTAISWFT